MKDSWRPFYEGVQGESDILSTFNAHDTAGTADFSGSRNDTESYVQVNLAPRNFLARF